MMILAVSKAALVLLLSASVLMPPAVRHAHRGGERPHDHAGQTAHAGHDHHDHAHHHHADDDLPAEAYAGRPTAHLHVTLFGFDFSLPDFGDESGDPNRGGDESAVKLVRLLNDAPFHPKSDSVSAALDFCAGLAVGLDAPLDDLRGLTIYSQRTVAALPLCDSARHARSGAQLI